MLERFAVRSHYCFLDGYLGYIHVTIALEEQENTTFTCPFGTYAFRRMPFGLCHTPATYVEYFFLILSPKLWKFLWMIILYMIIDLMNACFTSC